MATVRVAVVGDILMWKSQIAASRRRNGFHFDDVFEAVRPHFQTADLVIGNLETTLSGRESVYQRTNPKNGYPMFNCPDELAGALKRAGFHALTTANNHCLDRGERGLKRTLDILDQQGIQHTGTARDAKEAARLLIIPVKDVKIGVLAYTYGTNGNPVPLGKDWMVNRLWKAKIARDIKRMRPQADVILVAAHFGTEFSHHPNARQKEWVNYFIRCGADAVLGCHPHVLQPMGFRRPVNSIGCPRKFVIYSLGNFVSAKMWNNNQTQCGVILNLTIEKQPKQVRIKEVRATPTWTLNRVVNGQARFRVLPIEQSLSNGYKLSQAERRNMETALSAAKKHLHVNADTTT